MRAASPSVLESGFITTSATMSTTQTTIRLTTTETAMLTTSCSLCQGKCAIVAAVMSLSSAACGVGTSSSTASTATLTGYVTAGPTCPVERADHPCPPTPVAATVQAQSASGRVVASAHTDRNGRYLLRLRVGSYTVVALTAKMLPRCSPVKVTVWANRTTRAIISCDTGIR
jgi:hypothetical protein